MNERPQGDGLYLATGRRLRTGLLCLLYFAQGFPWGFATVALLSALSEAGHPKDQTATVTALAVLPWTFKFFWAPMIDSFRMPALGLRRPWIAMAQLGMAITLFGVWWTGDLNEQSTIGFIAWVFFLHNCFASLQDVATDALAVDLLDDTERGRVNGFMWGSKLFGIGVGGAGMGMVIASFDIRAAVLIQALVVVTILLVVLFVRERLGDRRFPWSRHDPSGPHLGEHHLIEGGPLGVLRELMRALSTRTTSLAVVMGILVNLCEGLWVPLTTDLFVREFQWSAEQFSRASGTWGVLGELFGALCGGFLCDRFGRQRMAGLGLVLTSATLLTFGFTAHLWTDPAYPSVLLLPLFKGFFAFTTVSLFSLYMKISWTGAAACQFTLYMAVSNVGHALGAKLNSFNNWFEDVQLSDAQFYLLAGFLALPPLIPMALLRPREIEDKKRLEDTAQASSAPGA